MAKNRWIQHAVRRPGALHRMLGIPELEKIPLEVLLLAARQPGLLGRRARLALPLRKIGWKRRAARKRRRYA